MSPNEHAPASFFLISETDVKNYNNHKVSSWISDRNLDFYRDSTAKLAIQNQILILARMK